jgi:polar amino acid transport system permease protein
MEYLSEILPRLAQGAVVTMQLTLLSAVIGIALALISGIARMSRRVAVRLVAGAYIEFFRGTSTIVLVFFFFYALPLLGMNFTPMTAGVLALSLGVGAYGAEIVRGAVLAVERGQREAALALNMRQATTTWRIVVPQAFVAMIPPLGNLLIELLKATAIVSLVTLSDLTFQGKQYIDANGHRDETYLLLLVVYFLLAYALTLLVRLGERQLRRHYHLELVR